MHHGTKGDERRCVKFSYGVCARAGWAPTGILNAEHRDCGFKSVRYQAGHAPQNHREHSLADISKLIQGLLTV